MMGAKTQAFHGKIDICSTKPVTNQPDEQKRTVENKIKNIQLFDNHMKDAFLPDAVIRIVIDMEREISSTSTSNVSLFRILPIGVVSK